MKITLPAGMFAVRTINDTIKLGKTDDFRDIQSSRFGWKWRQDPRFVDRFSHLVFHLSDEIKRLFEKGK